MFYSAFQQGPCIVDARRKESSWAEVIPRHGARMRWLKRSSQSGLFYLFLLRLFCLHYYIHCLLSICTILNYRPTCKRAGNLTRLPERVRIGSCAEGGLLFPVTICSVGKDVCNWFCIESLLFSNTYAGLKRSMEIVASLPLNLAT